MKLGFVSALFPDLDVKPLLEWARKEGFSCVELMCWPPGRAERKYAGVTHVNVHHFTQAKADDLRALCEGLGVSISALGYYPNALDPDRERARQAVEHLRRVIRAGQLLGLPTINTFVGRDWTRTVDENWPQFLKVWKPLVAFAEDHGVRIAIENCPMLYSRDEWPGGKNLAMCPSIWRRMFSDIPSDHFGLNYDPSHALLLRFDHLRPLREFRQKLFHIHAKDLLHDPEKFYECGILGLPRDYHQPRIPGFGAMNWAEFIAALVAVGYDGPVCIEVEDETFGTSFAGRERALRTARNVLRPLLVE